MAVKELAQEVPAGFKMNRKHNYNSASKIYNLVKTLIRHFLKCYATINLHGDPASLTHLKNGSVIITNHIHRIDFISIITVLPIMVRVVLAEDVVPGRPILSWLVRMATKPLGGIAIKRTGTSYNFRAIHDLLALLISGSHILLAPEGNKSSDMKLMRAKNGAVFLAIKARVPIVPIATYGYQKISTGKFRPKKPIINIVIGEPIFLSYREKASKNDLNQATDHVMRCLAQLLPPELSGAYKGL